MAQLEYNNGYQIADTYTKRFNAYHPQEIQFNLYAEDLIRKNYGKVNSYDLTFKPSNNVPSTLGIEILHEAFCHLKISNITQHKTNGGIKELAGKTDKYAVYCTVNDQDHSPLQTVAESIYIRVLTIDENIISILINKLEENHFKLNTNFQGGENVTIKFAFPSEFEPIIHRKTFARIPFDSIKQNYSDEISNAFYDLVSCTSQVDSGLVIMNGPPGTGKSYFIRSLLSEMPERMGVICSPASHFLRDMSSLGTVLTTSSKSLIILEDVGDMLSQENVTVRVDETANLLNITEGLLSLMADAIFVITFNYEVGKINPALLRHGRCLGRIEFNNLPFSKAQELLPDEKNLENREYTLAEIYAIKNGNSNLLDIKQTTFKSKMLLEG